MRGWYQCTFFIEFEQQMLHQFLCLLVCQPALLFILFVKGIEDLVDTVAIARGLQIEHSDDQVDEPVELQSLMQCARWIFRYPLTYCCHLLELCFSLGISYLCCFLLAKLGEPFALPDHRFGGDDHRFVKSLFIQIVPSMQIQLWIGRELIQLCFGLFYDSFQTYLENLMVIR